MRPSHDPLVPRQMAMHPKGRGPDPSWSLHVARLGREVGFGVAELVVRPAHVVALDDGPLEQVVDHEARKAEVVVMALEYTVHRLSHAALGELECFIGPVLADEPGMTYEAHFRLTARRRREMAR